MRMNTFISLILFILGIFFLSEAYIEGNLRGGLLIIFPFIYGSGLYAVIGSMFLFLSMIVFSFGLFYGTHMLYSDEYERVTEEEKSIRSGGAVVMIGPIPIVIASDIRLALMLFLLSIIIFAILIFILFQL